MSGFVVGQVGMRMGFGAAKVLYAQDMLDRLIVDTYFDKNGTRARLPYLGQKLSAKLGKYDAGIPSARVSSDWTGALLMRYLLKHATPIRAFTFANHRLNQRLIRYAKGKTPGNYYGFDTSSAEFLRWGVPRGWRASLEQCVAPRSAQIDMWRLFQDKYGMDIAPYMEYCQVQQERERKEWQLAGRIIVPSEYVRQELLKEHVPAGKIRVVPYGYTASQDKRLIREALDKKADKKDEPVRILFAGNSGYRKGLADLLVLAEKLKAEPVHFLIAGKLEKEATDLVDQYKGTNVTYLGKLSKEALINEYINADVFFFPSYLEGSALVLMEAMSWGLPIVTTHQSGSTVEHGRNGLLSDAGDVQSMEAHLSRLIHRPDERFVMGRHSLERSGKFTMAAYGKNLVEALTQ